MSNTASWLPSRRLGTDEAHRAINFMGSSGLQRRIEYNTGQVGECEILVHPTTLLSLSVAYSFHTFPSASHSYFFDLLDNSFLKHEEPVGLSELHANFVC